MPVNNVFKTRLRMERAARMESMGYPDVDIATAIHLTLPGLANLKMSDEYKRMRLQIATGIVNDMDAAIDEETDTLRDRLRSMVPTALQAIADNVIQKTDPKLRQQAAEAILDRDGRLIKASRTVVSQQDSLPTYMTGKDDEQVSRILGAQVKSVSTSKTDVPKTKDGETVQ